MRRKEYEKRRGGEKEWWEIRGSMRKKSEREEKMIEKREGDGEEAKEDKWKYINK